jgi:hypothetical protein
MVWRSNSSTGTTLLQRTSDPLISKPLAAGEMLLFAKRCRSALFRISPNVNSAHF